VVITELSGCVSKRLTDRGSGFELLVPDPEK